MGDGEDGPTHQPVEHLASLRAIPGLVTIRPGDANEVVEAYRYIMLHVIILPWWSSRGSLCRRSTAAGMRPIGCGMGITSSRTLQGENLESF